MSAWRKLGIVAGGGELPVALAEHCAAAGKPYWVSRIDPFADASLHDHPGAGFNLGEMGKRVDALKQAGCDAVVMIGNVPRPDFASLRFDERGQDMLPRLLMAAREGDDALLRVLVAEFAGEGIAVLGAEDVFADLLAPMGVMGAHEPSPAARADIAKAARVADALGALDVGQAVAVAGGVVLAVEAQEGTDSMLARVAGLPQNLRGAPGALRGVLLKRPKPIQERRMDLPTIGPATIEGAAKAGLAGVAVEAGGALILRRAEMVARADALGLFVYGFDPASP